MPIPFNDDDDCRPVIHYNPDYFAKGALDDIGAIPTMLSFHIGGGYVQLERGSDGYWSVEHDWQDSVRAEHPTPPISVQELRNAVAHVAKGLGFVTVAAVVDPDDHSQHSWVDGPYPGGCGTGVGIEITIEPVIGQPNPIDARVRFPITMESLENDTWGGFPGIIPPPSPDE